MLWRTVDRSLLRDAGAIGAAVFAIGLSYGAIAVASGLTAWLVVAMSVLVFAGGAQFLAVSLLAVGNPAAAVFGGLLLNARHLPFGLAVGGLLGRGWPARLVGSHLLVDESVAFAMAQPDPARRRTAYWLVGVTLFVAWQAGTGLGVLVGDAVGDPAAFGLDAAFPAGLLALLLPSLRDPVARRVAVAGAAVALLATPLLPAGAPILLALAGLAAAFVPRWPRRDGPAAARARDGASGGETGPAVAPASGSETGPAGAGGSEAGPAGASASRGGPGGAPEEPRGPGYRRHRALPAGPATGGGR
jgi:4-azaleucine resistance transporter AzlC